MTGYLLAGGAIAWSLATLAVSNAKASADAWLIRGGATAVMLALLGYAVVVPAGSLTGMLVCGLLQGVGFGVCGLTASLTVTAAKAAGFWTFAAFIPLMLIGLVGAWTFTRDKPA